VDYDPFRRGRYPAGVRTIAISDRAREREFACEVWYPASFEYAGADTAVETQDEYVVPLRDIPRRQQAVRDATPHPGTYHLIVFSHFSGGHRRASSFLCTHLASHGYIVAALDHSEVSAPDLARAPGETAEQKAARTAGWIASRVPDITCLLRSLLDENAWESDARIAADGVGLAGHSFGGWTVLSAADKDQRIRAVVALAPGGGADPRPGVLQLTLAFDWARNIPTLYLVAENDVTLRLVGMYDLFARTPGSKRMLILRRADHLHFIDHVAEDHEFVRAMTFPPEMAWMSEMRPAAELASEQHAHAFINGLALGHFDANVRGGAAARRFLESEAPTAMAALGIDAISI